MATATQTLLTAEDFARRPDPGYPEELFKGRIIRMPPARPYHGKVCGKIGASWSEGTRIHTDWARS